MPQNCALAQPKWCAEDLFEKYAKRGDNAVLKQFAQKTLPVIQQHLAEAKKLPL
jgi:predicted outer membrane protein